MADITSTTATSSTSSPVAPSASITAVPALPSGVPGQLHNLTRQIELTGTIAEAPDNGVFVLSTSVGNITITLPRAQDLKQDQLTQLLNTLFQSQKPITVMMQPGSPPTQVFLLLPNMPPAVQSSAAPVVPFQNFASTAITPLPGMSLPALVLPSGIQLPFSSSSLPLQNQPSLTALPTATTVPQLPLASNEDGLENNAPSYSKNTPFSDPSSSRLTPPLSNNSIQTAPLSPSPLAEPTPPLAFFPTASNATPALLQPGNEIVLKIVSQAPNNSVNSPPNQTLATVTGTAPNGEPILQVGTLTLYVKQNVSMPTGSSWYVTLDSARVSSATPFLSPDTQETISLQQVLAALNQIDPQLAERVLNNAIPQPNINLPTTLLFLMSAFKQGNLGNWIGEDAISKLAQYGKSTLIAKLGQEFSSAGQLVRDNVVGEWKSYPVPMFANNQFQIVNFYVHNNPDQKSSQYQTSPHGSYVRFFIDVQLSKLGPLQIDGLVRHKQLDIIVRSEHPLSTSLHAELRELYVGTLSGLDYVGTLAFQTGRNHWLSVQKTSHKTVVT